MASNATPIATPEERLSLEPHGTEKSDKDKKQADNLQKLALDGLNLIGAGQGVVDPDQNVPSGPVQAAPLPQEAAVGANTNTTQGIANASQGQKRKFTEYTGGDVHE